MANDRKKINKSFGTEKTRSDEYIAVENEPYVNSVRNKERESSNIIQKDKVVSNNSYFSINSETAIDIVDRVVFIETNRHLKEIEVSILEGSCRGQNYEEIAKNYGYTGDYLRNDAGPSFWKFLSQVFGEKVNKRNFRTAIERRVREQFKLETQPEKELLSKTILERKTTKTPLVESIDTQLVGSSHYEDWGEAPDVDIFYGREQELATLKQWIGVDRCRLVVLLGIGGIGKTALSVKLARQLTEGFDYVIWRSLRNAPPFFALLEDLIFFLSQQLETNLPKTVEGRRLRLLHYLRTSRCLLILDNGEAILETGLPTGRYRKGYEDYKQLFSCISEINHKSCLLLTSREKPLGLTADEGENLSIRTFQLKGLSPVEGQKIFSIKGTFSGSQAQWESLNCRYSGNPLALKILASTIRDFFERNIGQFLEVIEQGSFIFDDINDLLEQQWKRLSDLEREIMYWLAINREPISSQQLREDLVFPRAVGEFLQAIISLERRSLIETGVSGLTQQTVVVEYVTEGLIEKIFIELTSEKINFFNRYALTKADAVDYVRESQVRLILQPLIDRLLMFFRFRQSLENCLSQILVKLQTEFRLKPGYAAGNLLNLLRQLNINVKGYNFSGLAIWQANLQGMDFHEVNLSRCDLRNSVFNQTFASIYTLAFSPNGKFLAAGDLNGKIYLWSSKHNKPLWLSQEHENNVWSVTFSPDNQVVASGGADSSIKLWDVRTGTCLKTLSANIYNVWSVAFSPDGKILASSGDNFSVKLWDIESDRCLNTLLGHTSEVSAIAFSPDSKILASASADSLIKLWDLNNGKCFKTLSGHTNEVRSICFSPDGQLIASGSTDSSVKIWNVNNGECLKTLSEHSKWVWSVGFSPDGKLLASGSTDSLVKLWDVNSGRCLKTLLLGDGNWVTSVTFSSNYEVLGIGCSNSSIKLWDIKNSKWLKTLFGYIYAIQSIAFSPDGKFIASVSNTNTDRSLKVWNVQSATCLDNFSERSKTLTAVAFSPDGKTIVTGGSDCTLKLWDIQNQQCFKTFKGHKKWVHSVAFSPDGKMLVSGSDDFSVKLWAVEETTCLRTFLGHADYIWTVAFSPNGKIVASGSFDCSIKLWDINSDRCLKTLSEHNNWVYSVAFSPDGNILASGSTDFSIKLWDIKTGQCLQTLLGHSKWVESVTFSPDGTILASGSQDGTIKLWDVKTGQFLKTLRSPKPYEGTNITGATGLTPAQQTTLKLLGAIEN